ncbi:MAG: CoA transferase [Bifidobacteriaceae bacterium]|jgi:crotonobetainyl-CoA:carnitine CoA-transferase CaiB-like acyl-CoA transferase|nr:CoA transferase [Bifidobacteriaceae bacterium]
MAKALDQIRVLDFSWSVAGPTVTQIMAAHGAEVIKVEWPTHADPMRTSMFAVDTPATLDSGAFFSTLNIGKDSLTLNVGTEPGRDVIRRLIAASDVVVESFSAGMMRRWGFDYQTMSGLNPGIIYLSVSGFGHSGPYERYETWGPTAQAFNGLTASSGLPGREPAGWGYSYMDVCAGYLGAVALFAALHQRHTSGQGQYIDVAQTEAGLALTGAAMLDADVNQRTTERPGFPPGNRAIWPGVPNGHGLRGEVGAPYGLYPTLGGGLNDYCAITVLNQTQWEALVQASGQSAWGSDQRFASHQSRVRYQTALDQAIGQWTETIDKYQLMDRLQAAGVPAGALQSASDLMERDPQLAARQVFVELDHPRLGRHRYESIPIKYSASPVAYEPKWPLLSSSNQPVLHDVAGLSDEAINQLNQLGITWPESLERDALIEGSLW